MKPNNKQRISLQKYKGQEFSQLRLDSYYDFFIRDVREHPVLSQEETEYYFMMYKAGRQDAKDKLILHNLRLVLRIANNFWLTCKKEVPYMDLVQEGIRGLNHGIDKFDIEKGFQLSTYATWWIRQKIEEYYHLNSHKLTTPRYTLERTQKISNASKRFLQKHNRDPTNEELAELTGCKESEIENVKYYVNQNILSLEGALSDSGSNLADLIADTNLENPLEDIIDDKRDESLDLFLNERLDAKEKEIISLRYGLNGGEPLTNQEIAKIYGISRERIRQIENIVMDKLKEGKRKHERIIDFVKD